MLLENLLIFKHENKSLLFLGGNNNQLISNFCHICHPVYCFHLIVVAVDPKISINERTLEKQIFYFCNITT